MIDAAACLVELRGRIAEKPSWGRQELLVLMAEMEVEHRVMEDELDRALRLTLPAALDVLFNRGPALLEALMDQSEGAPASHPETGDARAARHSIAA